ncbi:MAG: hypothetical protein IPJ50_16030 [Betaproteobacteria bacterium]|nr:hypothetical protein [Betaproteobacteria bacterium]
MNSNKSFRPTPKVWLHNTVFASYAEEFSARLERGRYSDSTANRYLGASRIWHAG